MTAPFNEFIDEPGAQRVERRTSNGVMDFTPTAEPKKFRYYGEEYELAADLPVYVAMRYQGRVQQMANGSMSDEEQVTLMTEVLEWGIAKKDRARFRELLSEDAEHPLGLTAFQRLLPWMFEQFGLRPTEPSPESADISPSPVDGMKSTVSWPVTDLTSSPSDSTNY